MVNRAPSLRKGTRQRGTKAKGSKVAWLWQSIGAKVGAMQDFNKKVAVITGGASGIGLALARRALQEGMSVVLADIEDRALADAMQGLSEQFGNDCVHALRTDVSQVQDMDRLARSAYDRFGAVHLLFNNAGVGAGNSIVESTLADWKWVIDVNLMGIVHGIHIFVPRMIKQGVPCHVVNTASIAGMIANGPGLGIYKATKHAVVSLSETFYFEMKSASLPIGVSVLCPGFVRTRIHESDRNRPAAYSPIHRPPCRRARNNRRFSRSSRTQWLPVCLRTNSPDWCSKPFAAIASTF